MTVAHSFQVISKLSICIETFIFILILIFLHITVYIFINFQWWWRWWCVGGGGLSLHHNTLRERIFVIGLKIILYKYQFFPSQYSSMQNAPRLHCLCCYVSLIPTGAHTCCIKGFQCNILKCWYRRKKLLLFSPPQDMFIVFRAPRCLLALCFLPQAR